jgi:NAD(P)-dependent dehydrogenase (short-subunit alcohol dehydrogenase family)
MKKTVIVTGGAQGIGKGITRHLLAAGYAVVIADIDTEAGEETLQEYIRSGEIFFSPTDVADENAVRECVRRSMERFGRLDALVNNAGTAHAHSGPVENLSLHSWNKVIATNLTGCFLTVKHAAPHLRQTKGAIVNIASTRALQSEPHTEAYCASKGGLVSLTHSLAISLGPDIRVNCISPGWIDVCAWQKSSARKTVALTRKDYSQHPAGRVGTPADIAELVGYLVSDNAGFVTGQNFIADGGMTKKMIYVE